MSKVKFVRNDTRCSLTLTEQLEVDALSREPSTDQRPKTTIPKIEKSRRQQNKRIDATQVVTTASKGTQISDFVNVEICVCKECRKKIKKLEADGKTKFDIYKMRDVEECSASELLDNCEGEAFEAQQKEAKNAELSREQKVKTFVEARTKLLLNYKQIILTKDQIHKIATLKLKRPELISMSDITAQQQLQQQLDLLMKQNASLEKDFMNMQEHYLEVSNYVVGMEKLQRPKV